MGIQVLVVALCVMICLERSDVHEAVGTVNCNVMKLMPIWPQGHLALQSNLNSSPRAWLTASHGSWASRLTPLGPRTVLTVCKGSCNKYHARKLMPIGTNWDIESSGTSCPIKIPPNAEGSTGTRVVLLQMFGSVFQKCIIVMLNTVYPKYISPALVVIGISVNIKEGSNTSGKCVWFAPSTYNWFESGVRERC